ncbi:hypothetical protein L208DRAFT_1469438, partial [Tricholoma matsutake]
KNYTNKNNLWEPEENCKRAHNTIAQFFKHNPNASCCIARMVYEGMKFWPYQIFMEGTDAIFSCLEVEAEKGGNVRKLPHYLIKFHFYLTMSNYTPMTPNNAKVHYTLIA